MELDSYLSQTILIISEKKKNIDLFMLNSDLKQYILDESEIISQNKNVSINEAVEEVIKSIGTPEQFAERILSEVKKEKLYLLSKILVAVAIIGFPILIFIFAVIR